MIFAELQGKLGQNHSRAHERMEDVLTSTVFGLLRYLPLDCWLPPLAARVRTGPEFAVAPEWLDVAGIVRCDIKLWQRRSPFGEPDVMLHLFDGQGNLRHLVLIEVKLYSPKSGSAYWVESAADEEPDGEDEGDELAGIDQDQLARYWGFACSELQRLRTAGPGDAAKAPSASLIYLTAHATAPLDELRVSEAAAAKAQGADQPVRLGWLSWFDIWQVAYDGGQRGQGPLPIRDIEKLLSHKGFRRFVGFQAAELQPGTWVRAAARFWRRRSWFTSTRTPPAVSPRFWKSAASQR